LQLPKEKVEMSSFWDALIKIVAERKETTPISFEELREELTKIPLPSKNHNEKTQKQIAFVYKLTRIVREIDKELKTLPTIVAKIKEKHGLNDEKSLADDSEFNIFLEELKLDKEIANKIKIKYLSRKGNVAADKEYMEFLNNTDVELEIPFLTLEEVEPYIEISGALALQLGDLLN
jgi:hypothetical protein